MLGPIHRLGKEDEESAPCILAAGTAVIAALVGFGVRIAYEQR